MKIIEGFRRAMPLFNFHQAIIALTEALDLVGVDEVHHGKRVAVMAAAIGRRLGLPEDDCLFALQAGMLHDCGVSQTREHRHLTDGLEWQGAIEHCRRGFQYLKACDPLAGFAEVVLYHHTRWEALPPELDPKTRQFANLIFLADRVDILQAPHITGAAGLAGAILWEYPGLIETVRRHDGTLFAPDLVAAFTEAASTDAFWLAMDARYLYEDIASFPGAMLRTVDLREILQVARLFSHVVDAKSAYTEEHSRRVAAIARYLAERGGVAAEHLDLVEVAALLHDLGKLRVPDEIIESPGELDRHQRALIQRHAYDSYRILERVFPGYPIAEWAGCHHETLSGSGYPFHRSAAALPLEARIIAVADIFQALSQNRPYRRQWLLAEVLAHLERLAAENRVDASVVALLRRERNECYALATR